MLDQVYFNFKIHCISTRVPGRVLYGKIGQNKYLVHQITPLKIHIVYCICVHIQRMCFWVIEIEFYVFKALQYHKDINLNKTKLFFTFCLVLKTLKFCFNFIRELPFLLLCSLQWVPVLWSIPHICWIHLLARKTTKPSETTPGLPKTQRNSLSMNVLQFLVIVHWKCTKIHA